mmetsp:Transcript_21674/g.45181  ORF Transcript_21674/g.45181 Transcript_21674/m.45181 type:complete len:123 (+) Transcript_21674:102-470(+)
MAVAPLLVMWSGRGSESWKILVRIIGFLIWGASFVPGFFLAPVEYGCRSVRCDHIGTIENGMDVAAYLVMGGVYERIVKFVGKRDGDWSGILHLMSVTGLLGGLTAGAAIYADALIEGDVPM